MTSLVYMLNGGKSTQNLQDALTDFSSIVKLQNTRRSQDTLVQDTTSGIVERCIAKLRFKSRVLAHNTELAPFMQHHDRFFDDIIECCARYQETHIPVWIYYAALCVLTSPFLIPGAMFSTIEPLIGQAWIQGKLFDFVYATSKSIFCIRGDEHFVTALQFMEVCDELIKETTPNRHCTALLSYAA